MKRALWIAITFLPALPITAETFATVSVESRDLLRQSTQPATAEPFHVAEFGSMVTGFVEGVTADIGDRVTAGQALARIAVPDLEQLLRSQEAEARRVATDINAAQARLNATKAETDRVLALVKSGTVTSKAGDEARERLDAAQADLEAAQAHLAAAEARTAETQAMLDYATMKAPFDGVVIGRSVDPGDLVTAAGKAGASGQPLFRVARVDTLRVVTFLPERDAVLADTGDPVTIVFDALPGRRVEAKLSRLASTLDNETQRMRVEIDLPNPDGSLVAGLFGRATITLEEKANALVIPPTALRLTADGPMVYVVEDGRVRHQAVKIGMDDGGFLEIAEGLEAGDQVIVGSIDRLDDGAEVQVR